MENLAKNIFVEWFFWQFYEMPKFLLKIWNNYFTFATNLFSVSLLLKTFFAPWRKYNWKYPKGFNIVEVFNTFISNTFSRFLGAMMRIVLIIIGIIFQAFVAITGAVIFLGWFFMPFIIILGFFIVLFF